MNMAALSDAFACLPNLDRAKARSFFLLFPFYQARDQTPKNRQLELAK